MEHYISTDMLGFYAAFHPNAVLILRSLNSNPNQKVLLAEIASRYYKGGNPNDPE